MRITEHQFLKAVELISNYKKQIAEETKFIKSGKILYYDIFNCDFSVRLMNSLRMINYVHGQSSDKVTVSDVINKGRKGLLSMKGFGKKSMEELEDFLSKHNLELK